MIENITIFRNPAGSQLCSILRNVFVLAQSLNIMFSPALKVRDHYSVVVVVYHVIIVVDMGRRCEFRPTLLLFKKK